MSIESTIEVKLDEEQQPQQSDSGSPTTHHPDSARSSRSSPTKSLSHLTSPDFSNQADMPTPKDREKIVGGDITLKMEPGQPPKLARSSTKKVVAKVPQLFSHLADMTSKACSVFQTITECIYSSKWIGSTEHAMECDCSEEWGKRLLQHPERCWPS